MSRAAKTIKREGGLTAPIGGGSGELSGSTVHPHNKMWSGSFLGACLFFGTLIGNQLHRLTNPYFSRFWPLRLANPPQILISMCRSAIGEKFGQPCALQSVCKILRDVVHGQA